MKTMKRFLAMLVACLMVIVAFPVASKAASIPTKTLGEGKVGTVADWDGAYFKITVKGDGYITVSAAAVPTSSGSMFSGSYSVYRADKETRVYGEGNKMSGEYDKSGNFKATKFPVSAGTYYIKMSMFGKVKYSFTAVKAPKNYCKAKAMTWKKNKKVTVMQTPDYKSSLWFKVTLTKKQAISLTSNVKLYSSAFDIYNSEGTEVVGYKDWVSSDGTTIKTKQLKKGTYFIRLHEGDDFVWLKWK